MGRERDQSGKETLEKGSSGQKLPPQIENAANKKEEPQKNGTPPKLVGAKGFEPSTTPTPRECATGLRYAPISLSFLSMT